MSSIIGARRGEGGHWRAGGGVGQRAGRGDGADPHLNDPVGFDPGGHVKGQPEVLGGDWVPRARESISWMLQCVGRRYVPHVNHA